MISNFNFDRITEEMEMEHEDTLHLMTLYQGELLKDLNELEQILTEHSWLLVKNKLHKMKGDAANLCLEPLAETFAAMEAFAQNNDSDVLAVRLDAAKAIRTQFDSDFQKYAAETR